MIARALNDLFAALGSHGISVLSMRNKSNRLEELFLRLVERNLDAEGTA
jgi:ABC-2 type transport system ATP-binding protein